MHARAVGSRFSAWCAAAGGIGVLATVVACAPPSQSPGQPTVTAAQTQAAGTVVAAHTEVAPTVAAVQAQIAPTIVVAQAQAAPTVAAAQTQAIQAAATAQTQAAGTVVAAHTEVAPTVAVAQTQISAALQATATAVAPTAQAVATHVAPTVQAAATAASGAIATQVAASTVQVTGVNINSADTTVTIKNSGGSSENLRGWTLVMGPSLALSLSDVKVDAGQTVTVHLSPGTDTPTDVYVGMGSAVAAQTLSPGMRVVLVAPRDQIASVYTL